VVAEPQEPQGQAPQQEVREESAQGPTHPSAEQQPEGKGYASSTMASLDLLQSFKML